MTEQDQQVFAPARVVTDPAKCFFYHKMDLPGIGEVGGDWDLRGCVDGYLGDVDFHGKRVLDVGAASGFLSFEMEKRGAEVVSFDLNDGANWDIVPHYKLREKLPGIRSEMTKTLERLKNGYWLAHRSLGSHAQACYGNIYDIPKSLGEFDVVLYAMILTHLRDPFQALYNGARLCRDRMVVTGIFSATEQTASTFRPAAEKTGNLEIKGWYHITRGHLKAMLGVLGFEIERIVESDPLVTVADSPGPRRCQAFVARRISS